ncbi:hypothetical protein UFOVP449_209 [uncultured Caudovirales phage]|uniref:Uncharacterized protein n=1 Tax=uncultured Caudovirales phage TaxID=2100421 RepID=A0A6J5MEJ1_9CAUD|nr:hypothetical protein UFOVP449_209 [uncultured Caudovirales phage]
MAQFSKQWCELNDPNMSWDFDIIEVANQLKTSNVILRSCEGFGFSAIGKFDDGIKVYIRNRESEESDEQQGYWINIDSI